MAYKHRISYRRKPLTWLLASIVCRIAEIKLNHLENRNG